MRGRHRMVMVAVVVLLGWGTSPLRWHEATAQDQRERVSFSRQIIPILAQRCDRCHGIHEAWDIWDDDYDQADELSGTYEHRTYLRLRADAFRRFTVVPGAPEESDLFREIISRNGRRPYMPLGDSPLSPAEVELIRRWISEGAKEDEPTTPRRELIVSDVPVEPFRRFLVSCRTPVSAFLVLKVTDSAGKELFSRRRPVRARPPKEKITPDVVDLFPWTPPGDWADWSILPNENWPRKVNVRLTVAYCEQDPLGTVFVISYGEPLQRGAGHDRSAFQPNPAHPPGGGKFTFWLHTDSDVNISVSPQCRGASCDGAPRVVFEKQLLKLAQGDEYWSWDLKDTDGRLVPTGPYVARFRCMSLDRRRIQHDLAVDFQVDPAPK